MQSRMPLGYVILTQFSWKIFISAVDFLLCVREETVVCVHVSSAPAA